MDDDSLGQPHQRQGQGNNDLPMHRYALHLTKSTLKYFVVWLSELTQKVSSRSVKAFIDHLLNKRLSAKNINCYLDGISGFYDYMILT